jgi:hypothetical protein
MGSTPNTPSYWHDCKTPEPLPQAPPVLEWSPCIRVLKGNGFVTDDKDPENQIAFQATRAELATLAVIRRFKTGHSSALENRPPCGGYWVEESS